MTIDERIQALTESVELMSKMMQENEKRFEGRIERTHKEITRLARYARIIALSHETRLQDLEELEDDGEDGVK